MRSANIKTFLASLTLFIGLGSCNNSEQGCIPRLKDLKTEYPHVIYHGPKEPFEIVIKKNPPATWVPLVNISKEAQMAVLISEDWAFYSHPGYDEKQIKAAIEESVETGKIKRGASTITQQMVKNVYLTQQKSIFRKIKELWLATKVEKVLGKKRILEVYLNIAEWGEGIFGIGPAAQFYFHKSPAELNAKEGAFLAMLLPSPKKYGISFRKKELTVYARKTIHSILNKLVSARVLTPEQEQEQLKIPYSFESIDHIQPMNENTSDDSPIDDEEESMSE